jgi:transcriptional regulator with GAF, ATPase, and Fis domain
METWEEMTQRHKREKLQLVKALAQSRCTQTQAAKILDVKLSGLNNFIHRNNIF